MLGPQARRDLAEREVARRGKREQGYLAVEHREVDLAAAPGTGSSRQRGEDRDRDPQSGGEIRHWQPGLHRRAATLAGEAHDAAHRLEHGVVAFLVRVRPVLSEAGARDVDKPRVDRGERRIVEAELREGADREILDQHVGLLRQPAHQQPALVRAQVDGDRLLGAVADEVVGAVARELRLEAARLVAAARLLDLDDARAELGEDHGGERAREHPR